MKRLFYLLLLLQPIIDILTSLSVRFFPNILSVGQLFRTLTILVMAIYIFFYTDKRKLKRNRIILLILIVFSVMFLLNSYISFNNSAFFEISNILKYNYLILMALGFLNLFEQKIINQTDLQKIILINSLVIFSVMFVSYITKASFNSYYNEQGGVIGWFFSANELGAIVLMLMTSLYTIVNKNYKYILLYLGLFYMFIQIGTKASVYGLLLPPILYLLYLSIFDRQIKKIVKTVVIFFVSIIIINIDNPLIKDFNYLLNKNQGEVYKDESSKESNNLEDKDNSKSIDKNEKIENNQIIIKKLRLLDTVLSGRLSLAENLSKEYSSSSIRKKVFGIGFIGESIVMKRNVEMDLFTILFRFGIIGFLIYVVFIYFIILNIIKKYVRGKCDDQNHMISFSILIGLAYGALLGHVYLSPAVSIYLALFSAYIFYKSGKINKRDKFQKK